MSHMPLPVEVDPPVHTTRSALEYPFAWKATAAANANAAAALNPAPGSYAPTALTTVRDGSAVGLRVVCETVTAGTATIALTVNGVATSLVAYVTPSSPNGATVTGMAEFVAGDALGVSVQTSPDLLPASGWDVLAHVQAIVSVTNPAGTVNHGIPVISTTQWTTALTPNAAGTGWNYIAAVWGGAVGETIHWCVVKGLTSGSATESIDETTWHHYPNSNFKIANQLRAPNGRIFFPLFAPDTAYYDPVTEHVQTIGQIVESPAVDPNAATQFFSACFDSAGKLYMATQESHFRPSCVVVTDPTTTPPAQSIAGYVGSGSLSYTVYGYRIVADTGTATKYAYVAVGENPWQLWALNLSTGAAAKLYEVSATGNIQFAEIVVGGVSKGWTAIIDTDLGQPDNVRTQVWCLDGATYAYSAGVDPPGGLARVVTPASNPLTTPPDVDTTGGAGIVGWRPNGSSGQYTYLDYTVENAAPITLESLFPTSDGVGGNAQQYNGVFQYHEPADNHSWWGPWTSGLSEPCWLNVAGILYACGYPNGQLFKWDPGSTWALRTAPNNPLNLGALGLNGTQYAGIKYARRIAWASSAGVAGRVYVGGDRERNGTGCGIGYWDKQSGTLAGVYSSLDGSTGPANMHNGLTTGLISDDTNAHVILATKNISGTGSASLYVFNQALSAWSEYTPIAIANLGQIFPTSTAGVICGVTQGGNGGLALYRVNTLTGALLTYTETAIIGTVGAMCAHTNKSVWIMVGAALVRVDPDTLATSTRAFLSSILPIACMSFAADGVSLFMAGGSPGGVSSAQLYSLTVTP